MSQEPQPNQNEKCLCGGYFHNPGPGCRVRIKEPQPDAVQADEVKPCPSCGSNLIRSKSNIYPESLEHDLTPCWRKGNIFCPADLEMWNNAWAHKRIAELEKLLGEK